MKQKTGHLFRGPTGLEFREDGIGGLLSSYHICHSDEIGTVLDLLFEEFQFASEEWINKRLNAE